jgi:hypothetical protein
MAKNRINAYSALQDANNMITDNISRDIFVAVPMFFAMANFPSPTSCVQQNIYLLAYQRAIVTMQAQHRRRQVFYACGSHLWN